MKSVHYYRFGLLSLFLFFLASESLLPQSVHINEVMASNKSTILDPDYAAYSDWIELYNDWYSPVNLKNYSITDDLSFPQKFIINVDFIIPPKGFRILWADDRNSGVHTNFKLSATGQQLALFDSSQTLVDSLSFGKQVSDISFGRFPDGDQNRYQFSPASPGSENLFTDIYNKVPVPGISHQSGFYPLPIAVTVSFPDYVDEVKYTLDGSDPNDTSQVFPSQLKIDSTSVLRIRAFKQGFVPSDISTYSYFINEPTTLPVFSIATDPANFFSDTAGIYVEGTKGIIARCSKVPANWNMDWERPIELEFFEKDHSSAFKISAGVKIYGGCSRIYPMKSLAFYFRNEYGTPKLLYKMFPDIFVNSFDNIILRSGGQDWWRTMFREPMAQTLIRQGMNVDIQAYRPSLLFINGEYWGIHNVREKLDDHYLQSHFGVSADSIDLIEISKNAAANYGDATAYNYMITFFSNKNIALASNYEYVKSFMDIDEYLDYEIAQIYSANGDWPGSNTKLWRKRSASSKWRWMVYDLDFTFGGNAEGQYYTNTLEQATATNGPDWPNPPWATLILRKLLENNEFKNEFIQRFAVHMNTTYELTHVLSVIDSMAATIANEIPRHKIRWVKSITMGKDWNVNVEVMRTFAAKRGENMRTFIAQKFGLAGVTPFTVKRNNPSWGKIFAHGIELQNNDSTNIFFKNIPLKLKAASLPGYRFVKWEGITDTTAPEIIVIPKDSASITALFEPEDLKVTTVVINEINYNSSSSFDTGDWIELYNPVQNSVSLSGWTFKDYNENTFQLPDNSSLDGNNYLVLCRDTVKFAYFYPTIKNAIGNFPFGLNSQAETIRLLNASGNFIDSISFSSTGEWDSLANGTGRTLSLKNPQLDNSLPQSWKASEMYGTPGRMNDVFTKIEDKSPSVSFHFTLYQNYPNPFNPESIIRYRLASDAKVTLKVFDILGNEICLLVDKQQAAGEYNVSFSATRNGISLPSGVYFYQLRAGASVLTKKMLLLR